MLDKAVALREKQGGKRDLSDALCAQAFVLARTGSVDQSLVVGRRCVALAEEELGPLHPAVALALNNGLLNGLSAKGDYAGIETVLRRILAIQESAEGPEHADVALTLRGLSIPLRRLKRCGEALDPLHRSIRIYEKEMPASAVSLCSALTMLGACLVDVSRPAEAREALERSYQLLSTAPSPPPDAFAETRFHLARALWDSGASRERARALAMEARNGYSKFPYMANDLAEADRWLKEH